MNTTINLNISMINFNGLLLTAIAIMSMFLFSCEKIQEEKLDDIMNPIATRSIIDLEISDFEVTQEMAELFVKSNKDNLPVIDVIPYKMDDITCFYIFNFEKGFKVISADTRIQPILAESEEDNLYPYNNDNQGIKVWLEDTADRIKMLKTCNPDTGENHYELWRDFRIPKSQPNINTGRKGKTRDFEVDSIWVFFIENTIDSVYYNVNKGPLLKTKWGQSSPWNSKMPKEYNQSCLTGCVSVAISQVLYYNYSETAGIPNDFWHNISIQNTSTCPDHGGLLVALNKTNHTNNSSRWYWMPHDKYGNNTDYVSYLMLDIGERVNMHYGLTHSSVYHASDFSIPNISSCGISSQFGSYSFTGVRNSIFQLRPVIICASAVPGGGHVWVIDGCKDYNISYYTIKSYYCIHPDELINYPNRSGILSYDEMLNLYPEVSGGYHQVVSVLNDHQQSIHMNWGFDGNDDSWYSMLDSDNWIYTNPTGISYDFRYNRVMYHNITTFQLF